jgi:hypothetical protein
LKSNEISFVPEVPQRISDAIKGLVMGLMDKVPTLFQLLSPPSPLASPPPIPLPSLLSSPLSPLASLLSPPSSPLFPLSFPHTMQAVVHFETSFWDEELGRMIYISKEKGELQNLTFSKILKF